MKSKLLSVIVMGMLVLPLAALAQPDVKISIKAKKEMTVVKDGKPQKRLVVASKFVPGDIIAYTISYNNAGNEPAINSVIDDPIPAGTVYLPGSATGAGSDITFSIDKGKNYLKPSYLFYETKGANGKTEKRVASPDDYTNIRWTIQSIPPGGKGEVTFQVKVN
jgi:uncharacterized repeat protein (TIGR01451 family)